MRVRAFTSALLLGSAVALAQPLTDAKVYVSPDGMRAVTASAGADRCVVLVTGPKGELEGLVLDCRVVREGDRTSYFVRFHGREELAMRSEGSGRASLSRADGSFQYSEAESKKEDLAALWARHLAQQAAGQLTAVADFNRAQEIATRMREVTEATTPLNQVCGTKLTFTVDLSPLTDEVIQTTRPQRGCLQAIEVMQGLCKWKVVRRTFAEKLSEVQCGFGESFEPSFALTGKTLRVTSHPDTVSLPGALDRFLQENL